MLNQIHFVFFFSNDNIENGWCQCAFILRWNNCCIWSHMLTNFLAVIELNLFSSGWSLLSWWYYFARAFYHWDMHWFLGQFCQRRSTYIQISLVQKAVIDYGFVSKTMSAIGLLILIHDRDSLGTFAACQARLQQNEGFQRWLII